MQFQDQYILIPGTPIGDLQIRYYGIIIVTAMLVAAWIAARLAKRDNRDPEHIWGALTWAIFPGIIFARLWFVLFPPISLTAGCGTDAAGQVCMDTAWFFQNFFNLQNGAIAVWSGGLHIVGAIIGGLLGSWLYFGPLHNPIGRLFHYLFLPVTLIFSGLGWIFTAAYQRIRGDEVESFQIPRFESDFPNEGMNILPWLDIAAVALPLAQAVGRWANFINQELYGYPTNLPWGIPIDRVHRVGEYTSLVEYPPETTFHPLFLYESIWNFIAFLVLINLYTNNRERFQKGNFFLLYLAQYSFVRFFLEFLRIEKAFIPGTEINVVQVVTAIVFVVAVGVFLFRQTRSDSRRRTKTRDEAAATGGTA